VGKQMDQDKLKVPAAGSALSHRLSGLPYAENQRAINRSIHLAPSINMEGYKEQLGLWLAETEGAKFWLSVLTELKNRGLEDILIACVDGLKGFPDAIAVAYPQTKVLSTWSATRCTMFPGRATRR